MVCYYLSIDLDRLIVLREYLDFWWSIPLKGTCIGHLQSYLIKSPPWTILWFRILGIFSVENVKRLCVFMFQTWDNSQLLRRVLWISAELTIVSSLKHKNTQPLYIFNRVRVLHLDRLKEGTWLHSFGCAVGISTYNTTEQLLVVERWEGWEMGEGGRLITV